MIKITEKASIFIRAVQDVQPNGPYRLIGHSLGGLIAYEMACRFFDQGIGLDMIGVLDTFPPGLRRKTLRDRINLYRQEFKDIESKKGRLEYLGIRFRRILARLLIKISMADFLIRRGLAFQELRKLMKERAEDYKPSVYGGRLTFFYVAERLQDDLGILLPAWEKLSKNVDFVQVAGNHITLLREPYVQDLAQKIKAQLNKHSKEE
jgi:thioesterase domain-containing protein